MAADIPKVVPLTCHGHSRPITHLNFSSLVEEDQFYLISACKDNNPMLRDGVTGDWIGTFIGHKGAVWSSRLSSDATLAATGSADFTAKIWDPHSGECLHTLAHNHIVKAVAFPQQLTPQVVATGGNEKKLRIFDLTQASSSTPSPSQSSSPINGNSSSIEGFELGPGVHTASIKSIVWNTDYNILTTATDDKTLWWWDLRSRRPVCSFLTDQPITSCELNFSPSSPTNTSDTGTITVAAGSTAYFLSGSTPGQLLQKTSFDHRIASVALNLTSNRFVTGGWDDMWVRVWDYEAQTEIEVQKGHHGAIWSVAYSPDGKVYASGSEDGTVKLWKACKEPYGLWRV